MLQRVKSFVSNQKYWILISLIFFTLIYSTSLNFAYGVERTVGLAHFVVPDETLEQYFPDLGSLTGFPIDTYGKNVWKLTNASRDCGNYILASKQFGLGNPPYKYRILPPLIVHIMSSILQISVEMTYVLMNILVAYITAIFFNIYLLKDFNFSKMISFIGSILFITMTALTGTLPFPMLDPMSFLFSILIFISVKRKNPYLFIFSSIAGVLTKEVLVISSLMWFIETMQIKDKVKTIKNIIICMVPIIVFALVRMELGGSPFEVYFGHNPLKGNIPDLWKRLTTLGGLGYSIKMAFLSFSFLWVGIINVSKHNFFKRQIIIIPIVFIAAVSLSDQITRPLGILFPIVIPMFLIFFERHTQTTKQIIENE